MLRVTNLDDSGPGSLRAAIEAKGPRTIVFDVGGTIRLKKPLVIRNGQVTVAGQTAPGGGITVRDRHFEIAADDVVVRYIRARLGDEGGVESDAFTISRGRRIIVDHVSASWSVDETLSAGSDYKSAEGRSARRHRAMVDHLGIAAQVGPRQGRAWLRLAAARRRAARG